MTLAQASDDVGFTSEPTSSKPIFKRLYVVIYKTLALTYSVLPKECKNYYYAQFQADPCMFSYQNRRYLNRPILRPVWLMSAAVDVISVPSMHISVLWRKVRLNSIDTNLNSVPKPMGNFVQACVSSELLYLIPETMPTPGNIAKLLYIISWRKKIFPMLSIFFLVP